MTKILDISSQPQLAEILHSVERGDDVISTRDGRQIAEVKPEKKKSRLAKNGFLV